MKTLYYILGGFFVCVALLFFLSRGNGSHLALELGAVAPTDHVKGNASSTVVVVEYADFQCPSCRSYYPIVRQMVSEFGSQVAFVYRYFPLTGIHVNAEFAARAAEAAGKQGKFWEMHDLLFEKQGEWATNADFMQNFESYAELVGVSVVQFKADFNSEEVKNLVRDYKSYATKIGLQGTPTFYVSGKKIENPTSVEVFRQVLQNALKAQ